MADLVAEIPGGQATLPPRRLRFVVCTRDSARWFGIILDGYRALGVRPFVMLDQSSTDATEQLLISRKIDYAKVTAQFPRVESLIGLIPEHVHSEWVLRLDDDELPSRFLCAWLQARLAGVDRDVIGVQRRWIRLTAEGRCEYSRHRLIASERDGLDTQWRLFRPNMVQYRSDIHTPGFYVPKGSLVAPHPAYIAHFNWLVRTPAERRLQVDNYDRQEPNAGSRFRYIQVWEDGTEADHDFYSVGTKEFDAIARALATSVG